MASGKILRTHTSQPVGRRGKGPFCSPSSGSLLSPTRPRPCHLPPSCHLSRGSRLPSRTAGPLHLPTCRPGAGCPTSEPPIQAASRSLPVLPPDFLGTGTQPGDPGQDLSGSFQPLASFLDSPVWSRPVPRLPPHLCFPCLEISIILKHGKGSLPTCLPTASPPTILIFFENFPAGPLSADVGDTWLLCPLPTPQGRPTGTPVRCPWPHLWPRLALPCPLASSPALWEPPLTEASMEGAVL